MGMDEANLVGGAARPPFPFPPILFSHFQGWRAQWSRGHVLLLRFGFENPCWMTHNHPQPLLQGDLTSLTSVEATWINIHAHACAHTYTFKNNVNLIFPFSCIWYACMYVLVLCMCLHICEGFRLMFRVIFYGSAILFSEAGSLNRTQRSSYTFSS